jgi:hypothetical protein
MYFERKELTLQQALDMFFKPAVNEPYAWTYYCNKAELERRDNFYSRGVGGFQNKNMNIG